MFHYSCTTAVLTPQIVIIHSCTEKLEVLIYERDQILHYIPLFPQHSQSAQLSPVDNYLHRGQLLAQRGPVFMKGDHF